MLLGNATSGVSLGLSNIIDALTTQRAQVETMLALGATRWEATQAHVHRAIITAMTPVLNQMSVVGVVSIPGMMTGQILGGQAPMQAARYQVPCLRPCHAATSRHLEVHLAGSKSQLMWSCHPPRETATSDGWINFNAASCADVRRHPCTQTPFIPHRFRGGCRVISYFCTNTACVRVLRSGDQPIYCTT